MSDFNKVIMMGRLADKPELKFTSGGTAICSMRLCSGKKFKNKAGEEKEEVCFVDVTVWDKLGEICAEHLIKGQKVLVEGQLVFQQWEKDGQKRSKHEIRGVSVVFLEKPKGSSSSTSIATDDAPVSTEDSKRFNADEMNALFS